MLTLPRFFKNDVHKEQLLAKLKLSICPFCNRQGSLIRNGKLKGNDANAYSDQVVNRGQRILCSKRAKNYQGCGKSLSIWEATYLPGLSVDALVLSKLLIAWAEHHWVHQGWQGLSKSLSLNSAYRLWRRFGQVQSTLRQRLARISLPAHCPDITEPRHQLTKHLKNAFNGADCPVTAFQAYFQTAFMGYTWPH